MHSSKQILITYVFAIIGCFSSVICTIMLKRLVFISSQLLSNIRVLLEYSKQLDSIFQPEMPSNTTKPPSEL